MSTDIQYKTITIKNVYLPLLLLPLWWKCYCISPSSHPKNSANYKPWKLVDILWYQTGSIFHPTCNYLTVLFLFPNAWVSTMWMLQLFQFRFIATFILCQEMNLWLCIFLRSKALWGMSRGGGGGGAYFGVKYRKCKYIFYTSNNHGLCKCICSIVSYRDFDLSLALLES
mgnify:CR=1 FL=1